MDLAEFKKALEQFCAERDWGKFHSPKNLAMALSVEAAELLEHFQWLTPEESYQLSEEQRAAVQDEIGDVLICLMNLSSRLNVNLLEAGTKKLEKVKLKYPVEKAKGQSTKYDKF